MTRSTDSFDDGVALAARVARGELGAGELMRATLERAAALDPAINAVCRVDEAAALAAADGIDRELAACGGDAQARSCLLRERPFLGVPLLLKDLSTAAVGMPSTMGSRFFGEVRWDTDSELVARYRRAGFVVFGRTTSPELGISATTEAAAYGGPTRNPWQLERSAGGSSGGAAAAVAAGIVPLAHASDGAGSIRIPAACCGLVGLKPSRGLMPAGPQAGEGWGGLATEHVVSVSVRDTALALDVSAGADLGAPYAAPVHAGTFADALEDHRPRRIALLDRTLDGDAIDPEVAAAVRDAGSLLAQLGHRVADEAPAIGTREILEPMLDVIAVGTALAVDSRAAVLGREPRDDEIEPTTRGACAHGRSITGTRYLERIAQMHSATRRIARFFSGHDVLLMPVLAEPAPRLGRFAMTNPDYLDYRLGPNGIVRYSPFAPLANMTGQPAIAVPFAVSSAGLPIGIQLVGRFGDDATLIALAAALERARPWQERLAAVQARLAAAQRARVADRIENAR